MPEEIWKPVPSHPEVLASTLGRVRRVARVRKGPEPSPTFGSIRTVKVSPRFYYSLRVVNYKGVSTRLVHRLVCEAFHGPAPFPGAIVLYLDDDTHNNRPENLRWGTRRDNAHTGRFREVCRARKFHRNRGRFVKMLEPGLAALAA